MNAWAEPNFGFSSTSLQQCPSLVVLFSRELPQLPVSEFVDAMDAEVKAGRIRGPFGGSNWTRKRMDEAIAFAERAGKQKPSVLSSDFLRLPRCGRRSGLAASPPRPTSGRHGWRSARCRTSPGQAKAEASSPTAPAATSATMRS